MTRIAWVEEADIPCEPGAELCGDCEHAITADVWDCCPFATDEFDPQGAANPRRCPACLSAERMAAVRARIAKQKKEQDE